MEKRTMLAFAVLAAAMSAFAATFQFNKGGAASDSDGTFDWNTPSRWYVGDTVQNSLPTKDDDAYVHVTSLRGKEVYIRSGTAAECKILYLPNRAWSLIPVHLIIDGGSLTTYGSARLGNKSCGNLTIQNGGSFVAKSEVYIGKDNDETSSGTVYVTNSVVIADASSSFTTGTSSVYMGHQRKGQALLVNNGTISFGGQFNVGYCSLSGFALGDTVSIITNSGTISAAGPFRIAFKTNSVAWVENTGDITLSDEFTLGHNPYAQGYFRHSAGNLSVPGSTYVGLSGSGYLELAGDTKSVFSGTYMRIASNNGSENGSICSYGELVLTNSASLSRSGNRALWAGAFKHSTARIALYDDAKLSDISNIRFGNVKTDNSFEVYDNAVVSNVNLFVLNVGSTANDVTGKTTMKLSGNAKVCDIGNAYIGSNSYNRAELEIADNAWFGLRDDAWEGGTNSIHVAEDSYESGDVTIRLRGGTIALGIRGGLVLGSTKDNSNVQCTSRLIGYGCVTNQGDSSQTLWSRLDVRGGSVTADGEGEERDLDLRTFARISGSAGEGRSNLNISGTNGWYAINKGRLRYPVRDSGDSKARPRFVGDYARLDASINPMYVNSMRIIIKTNDVEVAMASSRYPFVDLYAPDRTDIPAGLVGDDAKNRRLGIWHGTIATGYANTARRSFHTADVTIRYDQWRLDELKDAQGNYPPNLEIRLYKHDGTVGGKWRMVTKYPVTDAETNGYRISGELESVSGTYNLGWFAVVAKSAKGTCIAIR